MSQTAVLSYRMWVRRYGGERSLVVAITPDGHRVVYSARESQSDVWIAHDFDGTR